jgi:sigma-E factor negative regulatory protein RseA
MNAVTRTPSQQAMPLSVEEARRLSVSALVDGELSAAELDALFQDKADLAGWDADWRTFHLIGDVLRGSEPVAPSRLPPDFAATVMGRLHDGAVLQPVSTESVVHLRGASANDAVFRWKLVAGLASMAAVAAVGWALVGTVTPSSGAGPQMALTSPTVTQDAPQEVPQAVVVQTPQGQVLRDARLEQLLAEHRQYGGMSALQMPAGFLRNATYDAAPQR